MNGILTIKTSHYFIAGVALVTAISWNGAIKDGINKYFPMPEENVIATFIYAICMTLFLIFLIHILPDTSSELPKPVKNKLKMIEVGELTDNISELTDKIKHLEKFQNGRFY